jgi:hypothetical protein
MNKLKQQQEYRIKTLEAISSLGVRVPRYLWRKQLRIK